MVYTTRQNGKFGDGLLLLHKHHINHMCISSDVLPPKKGLTLLQDSKTALGALTYTTHVHGVFAHKLHTSGMAEGPYGLGG